MRRPRLTATCPSGLTYVFLYTPIVVLVVMSFNAGESPYTFERLQPAVVRRARRRRDDLDGPGQHADRGRGATVLATVLGTLLAVGLARHTRSRLLDALALLPAILPDLVLAIGLLRLLRA